jgi:hypothetical protein
MSYDREKSTEAMKAFIAADDAWSAELTRQFGKQACEARYRPQGRGVPGSTLAAAHDAREACRAEWERIRTGVYA